MRTRLSGGGTLLRFADTEGVPGIPRSALSASSPLQCCDRPGLLSRLLVPQEPDRELSRHYHPVQVEVVRGRDAAAANEKRGRFGSTLLPAVESQQTGGLGERGRACDSKQVAVLQLRYELLPLLGGRAHCAECRKAMVDHEVCGAPSKKKTISIPIEKAEQVQ